MSDKQLLKQCLTYIKRGRQPITRDELIKAVEARLVQTEPTFSEKKMVEDALHIERTAIIMGMHEAESVEEFVEFLLSRFKK